MTISYPTNTRDIINQIRTAIGRDITFYVKQRALCQVCSIDPITDESTDPFCPICSGVGYIVTYSGHNIIGHVTWAPSETLGWVTGGQYIEGDCRVQIEHTVANLAIVEDTDHLTVDGKNCIIRKKMLRGVQDINRIILDLSLEE